MFTGGSSMQLQRHVIYTRCNVPRGTSTGGRRRLVTSTSRGSCVHRRLQCSTTGKIKVNAGRCAIAGRADGARQKYYCCYAGTVGHHVALPRLGPREGRKTRNKNSVQSFFSKLPSIRTIQCFGRLGIFQTNGRVCALCLGQIVVNIHGSLPKGEDCSNENENSTIALMFLYLK